MASYAFEPHTPQLPKQMLMAAEVMTILIKHTRYREENCVPDQSTKTLHRDRTRNFIQLIKRKYVLLKLGCTPMYCNAVKGMSFEQTVGPLCTGEQSNWSLCSR